MWIDDNMATIREAILSQAARRRLFTTADVRAVLNRKVSRQYVSAAINRLVREGALIRGGATRGARYALPKHGPALRNTVKWRLRNASLNEDDVLDALRPKATFMAGLRENVADIFTYGFLEMLNNAIEHSQSKAIEVAVAKDRGRLEFIVNDFGVGVFRNVMQQRGLTSELDAIQDVLKGKTTTQPEAHSGEGIFFTAKVADVFLLESFRRRLRVDNLIQDYFIEEVKPAKRGTRVTFQISEDSKRRLSEVFKRYQADPTEPGFDQSEIKVKLYALDTVYLSRSQARRLLAGLEKFRSVTLDFAQVRTIGQGFADEVFRVFRKHHPETRMTPINMNEPVRFMIERVGEAGDP